VGITAAGTVPDSHWIPLHQAASAAQIAISAAKVRKIAESSKLSNGNYGKKSEKLIPMFPK